ncbi:hypothetical protein HK405_003220 [Cladochytrium tenue]|nr:hypothetical protein HK405_003220 [Cladochytrium tenue]
MLPQAQAQPQPPERSLSSPAAASSPLQPPLPLPPPPHARYTVTCLVLGRPPSAAFLVNCADGALTLTQLARRIDSILHSTTTTTAAAPADGIDTYPGATDADPAGHSTPPPLQLFLVVKHATHRLNLASSVLNPSDGRVRKIMEKTSTGHAARAHELSALLGGGCVWVTGPLLSSAVRDVLGSNTDRDDAAVDFLVALDDPIASTSGNDLASAGLPAYADIDGAPRQQTITSDDGTPPHKAVNGGALFDKEPPRQSQYVEASPLMTPATEPDPSRSIARDVPEAEISPLSPPPNRQKRMVLIGVIVAVLVVIVVGISVAVVVSKRKAADSDSSTDGGAQTSAGGGSSGSVSADSATTEPGSLGASTSAGATGQLTTSAAESGSSASSPSASAATSTTAQSTTSTSSTTSSACSQYQLDSFTSTTNNLGYVTGDDGTMKSISRSGNAVHFVPTSSSYYYEALLTDNGDGTCSAHQPAFNYLTFTITGAGTAVVDVITGCEGAYHYTPAFPAGSSSTTYVVDILAVLGGSTSLAASLYSVSWGQYAVNSSTATWSLSGVYIVNDLAACGISATVLS